MRKPLTKQEVFDLAVTGVLKQGKPSIIGSDCKYRGTGGTKCAAGFCIPDNLYRIEWDTGGQDAEYVLNSFRAAYNSPLVESNAEDVLKGLQECHDKAFHYTEWNDTPFVDEFRLRAKVLGENHSLNLAALETQPA